MEEIIKLLPNGASVVSVIAVVMIFIKQLDKANDIFSKIATQFDARLYESQKNFQAQVLEMSAKYTESQRLYQEQVNAFIKANLSAAQETVIALKGLEATMSGRQRSAS